jgi:hypothetical protein
MKDEQLTDWDQETKLDKTLKQQALEKLAYIRRTHKLGVIYDDTDLAYVFELIEQAGLELPL